MRTTAQYLFQARVPQPVPGGLPLLRSFASVCGTCHTDPTGGGVEQTPFLLEKNSI